jgi:hypothetical protein
LLGLTAVIVALAAAAPIAQGANPLDGLESGSRIKITLQDGVRVTGRVLSNDADHLLLGEIQGSGAIKSIRLGTEPEGALRFRRSDVKAFEVVARPAAEGPSARSFEQLQVLVVPGDKVSISDPSGAKFTANIARVNASSVSVKIKDAVREFQESEIETMRQRRPDSVKDGALAGLAVGAGLSILACGRCHLGDRVGLIGLGFYGGIGAAVGAGIDALIKTDMVVYRKRGNAAGPQVSVVPQLAKSHKGVAVSVRF